MKDWLGTTSIEVDPLGFIGFTGYQPDGVSGLQYAQARYYAPTIGRFGAEDTVRDGFNYYLHCYNNPLRFVDKNGLWGEEVHYDDTITWAKKVGFSQSQANIIGDACNGIDSGSTGPMPWQNQSYHFNTASSGDSRNDLSTQHYNNALSQVNNAQFRFDMEEHIGLS